MNRKEKAIIILLAVLMGLALALTINAHVNFSAQEKILRDQIDERDIQIESLEEEAASLEDSIRLKQISIDSLEARYSRTLSTIRAKDEQITQIRIRNENLRNNVRSLDDDERFDFFSEWISEADSLGQ